MSETDPRVEYHRKRDGILRVDHRTGACRFLTAWERLLLLFGRMP